MMNDDAGVRDEEIAYAKLNLALHVRKRRTDGYHEIETLFAFLNNGDRLSVEEDEELGLSLTGPFADGLSEEDNLVLDAARLLASYSAGTARGKITLDKRLPVASGIGGGSADAAASLRMLNRFWGLDLTMTELEDLSRPLGADVPACIFSRTCRADGIGQDLHPVVNGRLDQQTVLLVNPLIPVPTGQVFAKWDGLDKGGLGEGNPLEVALTGRNDLEEPALAVVPMIGEMLKLLEETEPLFSRMSGSGATCFALFETEERAREARIMILTRWPDLWTVIGQIR